MQSQVTEETAMPNCYAEGNELSHAHSYRNTQPGTNGEGGFNSYSLGKILLIFPGVIIIVIFYVEVVHKICKMICSALPSGLRICYHAHISYREWEGETFKL